jgi:NAD-dependent oxidoreductase involved in siderophore biosynthesis
LSSLQSYQHPLHVKNMQNNQMVAIGALCWPCHVNTLMKKLFTCWCKQPKTSMARGRNAFIECWCGKIILLLKSPLF